jgi:hypothetical protein
MVMILHTVTVRIIGAGEEPLLVNTSIAASRVPFSGRNSLSACSLAPTFSGAFQRLYEHPLNTVSLVTSSTTPPTKQSKIGGRNRGKISSLGLKTPLQSYDEMHRQIAVVAMRLVRMS